MGITLPVGGGWGDPPFAKRARDGGPALALRRRLQQSIKLFVPLFVAEVEAQRLRTIAAVDLTTDFSALGKVVAVVGDYRVRVERMAA